MRTVTLSPEAIKDLEHLRKTDSKLLAKIITLIAEIAVSPFEGTGRPEPLKYDFKGKWSRRITQEHRLVYAVTNDNILIVSCMYHYK